MVNANEILEEKRLLRRELFEERRLLDAQFKKQYDKRICRALEQLIEERKAQVVHAYLPIAGEINILPLIKTLLEKKILVVCPKTLGKRQLENRILHDIEKLEPGPMGTYHPAEADLYQGNYDLIIVPGLAVDIERYRLGYGGGYYDTFLAAQTSAHTVGIYYPFQELILVPREPHDVQVSEVLIFEDP